MWIAKLSYFGLGRIWKLFDFTWDLTIERNYLRKSKPSLKHCWNHFWKSKRGDIWDYWENLRNLSRRNNWNIDEIVFVLIVVWVRTHRSQTATRFSSGWEWRLSPHSQCRGCWGYWAHCTAVGNRIENTCFPENGQRSRCRC